MSAYQYYSFCSPYYRLFCELGYPQLDLRFTRVHDEKTDTGWETGEWNIYEMVHAPLFPSTALWRDVLTGIRHVEINKSNLKRLIDSIDPMKDAIWDRERKKTKAVFDEDERTQRHRDDISTRMTKAITQNPDLVQRIAKNGIEEIDPAKIIRHIPRARRSY